MAIDRELLRLLSLPESLLEREGVLCYRTSVKARSSCLHSAHEVARGAGPIHEVWDSCLTFSHHFSLGCLMSGQRLQTTHWRHKVVLSLEVHLEVQLLVILTSPVATDRVGVALSEGLRL